MIFLGINEVLFTTGYFLLFVYTISLLIIFMYVLAQLNLLFNYLKSKFKEDNDPVFDLSIEEETPYVTVQLPVYNEEYVMERLLDNIVELDYPKDKLEIQVLDDSTDDTVKSTAAHVEKLKAEGHNIQHITRTNRVGFKAGALKEGLEIAKGEFIAIFDAAFLTATRLVGKTVPHFKSEKIGVVQTRWSHINRNYSLNQSASLCP